MNFMAHIADTLTEAGHNVTFLVPVADEARKNQLGVKFTKDVVVVERDEIMIQNCGTVDENTEAYWTLELTSRNVETIFGWFSQMMSMSCANLLRNKQVLEDMKKRNFDVAITEGLGVCGLGMFKKLGIEKTIIVSSVTLFEFTLDLIGEPEEYSYVPVMAASSNDQMNIIDRYENYQMGHKMTRSMFRQFDNETEIYRQLLGEEIPYWKDLFPAASLYFTNSNPYVDFPRSAIQKTVPIGGITVDMNHIKSQKLSEEWDEVLNRRNKTMLISFGSMVKSSGMPLEWRQNIFNAILSLPDVTFIWKYESNDTEWASEAKNFYFSKWIPQTALLADPRITAFLTHAGLGSINELVHCGKPSLMVPLFGDQLRNALMMERHNTSITIRKNTLDQPDVVRNGIYNILYDESYGTNAKKLANLLENQPSSPKDLVVKHIEFVAKFGPFPQMDPYVRHLNYFQRNFLDIYAITAFAYFLLFALVFVFSVFVLKFFRKSKID